MSFPPRLEALIDRRRPVSTFSYKYPSRLASYDAGPRQAGNRRAASLSLADWPAAGAATPAQLWLIEIAGCEIHLVGSDAELRNLLRRRPVTGETQVYEVGARPRALQNVPELARLLPQAADSEPPIRQPRPRLETRSPERIKLSEELAVLNRPLEDEVEVLRRGTTLACEAGVCRGDVCRRARRRGLPIVRATRSPCKNAHNRAGGRANAGRTDRSRCSGGSRQQHVRQRPPARTRRRSTGAIRNHSTQPRRSFRNESIPTVKHCWSSMPWLHIEDPCRHTGGGCHEDRFV